MVWPEVEALLLVPISAHALFARPMVASPDSTLAVEVLAQSEVSGVLWCDGRRPVDLPAGARVEVRRGARPVRLARLHEAPFTDRLVAKFDLPVSGWRGRQRAAAATGWLEWSCRCLRSSRIRSLGVIDEASARARTWVQRGDR